MRRAEVLVGGAVAEHVPDRGEHRGGYGDDGLLRAATSLEPVVLAAQVRVLLVHGAPGALDEHGLEPWCALTDPRALPLASALVELRAQPSPRHEVRGGRELA